MEEVRDWVAQPEEWDRERVYLADMGYVPEDTAGVRAWSLPLGNIQYRNCLVVLRWYDAAEVVHLRTPPGHACYHYSYPWPLRWL